VAATCAQQTAKTADFDLQVKEETQHDIAQKKLQETQAGLQSKLFVT